MFAFAAMLSTVGLVLRYLTTTDEETISAEESNAQRSAEFKFGKLGVFWRPLLGAAMGWFMYDLVEYGLKSNDTDLFGHGSDPLSEARGVSYNRYFQILPLAIAAAALTILSTKQSQMFGFLGCGIICSILAADYDGLHSDTGSHVGFDTLYILQMAFQAFCGTTTLAIPSQVFPRSFVGTGAGISAATGKIGATVGTYLFAAWDGEWVRIFITCTATCVLGLLVTLLAVPHYRGEHLKRMESLAAAGLEKQAVQSLYNPLSATKHVDEPPKQPLV
jgi:PHS family inorganic phosphate transporter-like MFS transporter